VDRHVTVAVCVPFRARNDHEVRLWDWCSRWWGHHFPDWSVFVADSGADPFNRAASRNAAVAAAVDAGPCPDVLVFANADTVHRDPHELSTAVAVAAVGGWSLPATYVETAEDWTGATLAADPGAGVPDPFTAYERQLADSPAGPQIIGWDPFRRVNGWDERYVFGWGREDTAFVAAAETLVGPASRIGTAVHLWHPRTRDDTFRARGYGQSRAMWMRTYGRALRITDSDARRRAVVEITAGNTTNG
jgi:hypothetical protein